MKSRNVIFVAVMLFCLFNFIATELLAEPEHADKQDSMQISSEMLNRFGLEQRKVAPSLLASDVKVAGRITPIDEKLSHVSPRFSGVVREVRGKIGQFVQPGEQLALIQNNQNLQTFSVSAAITGMVVRRHATLGETVGENSVLFVVADLSSVWAELAVYKQDVSKVKIGQKVLISLTEDMAPHTGEIVFFSPITEENTQSRVARVLLDNHENVFSPGAFVTGSIVTAEQQLDIAVTSDSIQKIRGRDTLFIIKDKEIFPRVVKIGRSDEKVTELIDGVKLGETYLSGKTFLLKAELGKSEAGHED